MFGTGSSSALVSQYLCPVWSVMGCRFMRLGLCLAVPALAGSAAVAMPRGPVSIEPPNEARVAEMAGMLGKRAVVPPYGDEAFWARAAKIPYVRGHVRRAERALDVPTVDLKEFDRSYRRFMKDGNRTEFQRLIGKPADLVRLFVLAECVERKGRFIEPLEKHIKAICGWPTWFLTAHDSNLTELEGKTVRIDLGVAMRAADLSACLLVLRSKLEPKTVALVKAELRRRVLEPYRREILGKQKPMWWLLNTNNWSAVCHTGVILAALAAGKDTAETAWFIASTERMLGNFLAGFTEKGYCSEGIGYWVYGYGHFIITGEYIRRATGGGVDLFSYPRSVAAARFPLGMHLCDDVYPAFADCSIGTVPSQPWTWYVARRLGVPDPGADAQSHPCAGGFGLYGRLPFIDPSDVPGAGKQNAADDPLRSTFSEGGVFVMRAPGPRGFAVAVKAGHNDEHHNHNDLGSFVVAAGGVPILCDPGKEEYTRFTFSKEHRYKSPVHNSYGHPVPVVAGKLQGTGREYGAGILEHKTSSDRDEVLIDLTRAYAVPGLVKLQRRLVFERKQRAVTVTDQVTFKKPQSFGTALVTYGKVSRRGSRLTIVEEDATVKVGITVEGGEPVFDRKELKADWLGGKGKPVENNPLRIGITCDKPVTRAAIRILIHIP